MRVRGLAIVIAVTGCFSGDTTIGAFCVDDDDCGSALACEHAICGRCGDGSAQRGEVCRTIASEPVGPSGLTDLLRVPGTTGRTSAWIGFSRGGEAVTRFRTVDGRVRADDRLPIAGPVAAIALSDLDDDGVVDLAVAIASPPALAVHWGDGEGFADAPSIELEAEPIAVVHDGARIVVATAAGSLVGITAADRTLAIASDDAFAGVTALAVPGDLDEDGVADLVVAADDRTVTVVSSGGEAPTPIAIDLVARALDPIDLDGDGRPDLAAVDPDGHVALLLDGGGGLVLAHTLDVEGSPTHAVAIDLNRDTQRDILVTAGGLLHFVARGRAFPDRGEIASIAGATAIDLADLRGDGVVEIVALTDAGLLVLEADP